MLRKMSLIMAIGIVFSLIANAYSQKNKVESQNWEAESDVLGKYLEISALSKAKQLEFFNKLSSRDKSELVRIHIALNFAVNSALTNEQKEILLEAISFAKPEIYEIPRNNPEWINKVQQPTQTLVGRALGVFSKSETAQIFMNYAGDRTHLEMLQRYIDFSRLSETSGKQYFAKTSDEERSGLWKTQLALSFAEHPGFNRDQKELILELIAVLTPELYNISKVNSLEKYKNSELAQSFVQRINEIFSKDLIPGIFYKLGKKSLREISNGGMEEPEAGFCMCSSTLSVCDLAGSACAGNNCYILPIGCGPFGVLECDGVRCKRPD